MSFHSTHTTVLVEDLQIEVFVGHHAPERSQVQVISLSISCELKNPEVAHDDLEQSFDYVRLVANVKALALSRARRLIETLAEEVAETCFACPRVKRAVVSIRKPHKLPAVEAVGVTRTFERK